MPEIAIPSSPDSPKCPRCMSLLSKGTAAFHDEQEGYLLILDRVPAWVCDGCGEVIYEDAGLEDIQRTLHALTSRTRELARAS